MAKSKTTSTINAFLKLASLPVQLDRADTAKAVEQLSALVFEAGGETYAVGVENVEGVVDCPRLTPLPNPPDGVTGVVSVRGRMTLVMRLNDNDSPPHDRRRLILLKGDSQIGLTADRIDDVVSFPKKELRAGSGRQKESLSEAADKRLFGASFVHKGRRIPLINCELLVEA